MENTCGSISGHNLSRVIFERIPQQNLKIAKVILNHILLTIFLFDIVFFAILKSISVVHSLKGTLGNLEVGVDIQDKLAMFRGHDPLGSVTN